MEKTKKSIFSKIFVCLSLCLVLLGALAPCFSMNKNQPLKAETYSDNISFSDFWVPYDYFYYGGFVGFNCDYFVSNQFDFSAINGSAVPDIISGGTISVFDKYWLSNSFNINFSSDSYNNLYIDYLFSSDPFGDGKGGLYFLGYGDRTLKQANKIRVSSLHGYTVYFIVDNNFAFKTYVRCDSSFNYKNVLSLHLFTGVEEGNGRYLYFVFQDSSGYELGMAFYIADDFKFSARTYYFSNGVDLTDNEFYNQGYNAGQNDGYNKGYSVGEYDGYNSGYKAGNTVGYENGYNKGLNDSNQYTFINLIGATIDAPIQYFKSLFNFELLGVNLSNFLMGLFTLCIIVTIVKLCLGR